jgi:nitroimidazol reductase NimA-like FMN-containing flavoprotein (pyridoxamine 5'-phosphate oxidase superfamily)
MAGTRPVAEKLPTNPGTPAHPAPTPWAQAQRRLAAGEWYRLATVRPDGRPHVVPLLAVWLDDALYVLVNRATRKARNLAHDPQCAGAVAAADAHLVVEGQAAKVSDRSRPPRLPVTPTRGQVS